MLVSTVTATTLKPVDRLLVHLCHVLKLLSRNFETILLKCAHFPTDLTESLWRQWRQYLQLRNLLLFFDQWWWKPTPLWSWRASCVHALTEEEPVGFDQETKVPKQKKPPTHSNTPSPPHISPHWTCMLIYLQPDPGFSSDNRYVFFRLFFSSCLFVTVPQSRELHVWTKWTSVPRSCTKDFITFP